MRQIVRIKEKQQESHQQELQRIKRDHEAEISDYKRRIASMKKIVLEWSKALAREKNLAMSVEQKTVVMPLRPEYI